MKHTLKTTIGIVSICLIALAACKKKKDDSVKARLSGKWTMTQVGTDANNNNVMDASEVVPAPDTLPIALTFKGDGNGDFSTSFFGTNLSLAFTWTLSNSDKDINIKPASTTTGLPVTEGVLHIYSLTGAELVVKDTATIDSALMNTWTVYKKQ
jgi:hypothetical protein